jgi:hypothetical protein
MPSPLPRRSDWVLVRANRDSLILAAQDDTLTWIMNRELANSKDAVPPGREPIVRYTYLIRP